MENAEPKQRAFGGQGTAKNSIRADTKVAMANELDTLLRQLRRKTLRINDNIVIAQRMVFEKVHLL